MTIYSKPWNDGALKVSMNHKYLQNGEKPFFWLADTGWLLFHRFTREEVYAYLRNRKAKGFNVIQAMILHRMPQLNRYNRQPFFGDDITKTDDTGEYSYWDNVDYAISLAEELGLYIALVPAWGDILKNGYLNADTVEPYTRFIAGRYKGRPNIIWIVGGDLLGSLGFNVWDRMGEILREMCPDHLITFHPVTGTTSSLWFNEKSWLDFNMFQSGHSTYAQVKNNNPEFISDEQLPYAEDNWKYIFHDHGMKPLKPSIDGEPSYENIMKGLKNWGVSHWTAADVRRYSYWSVFAGGFGITYGHNAVMQGYYDGAGPGSFGVMDYWYDAIHHEGSGQIAHLKELVTSFPFTEGTPRQDCLACDEGAQHQRIAVFGSKSFLLAYTCTGRDIAVKANSLDCEKLDAFWFNPVGGEASFIGSYHSGKELVFTPVERKNGVNDWVLVLFDREKQYL